MTGSTRLLELQKRQKEHDKEHHPDIYNTSYPDRMNHYVLHFSKYVGRLSREYNNETELEEQLKKTLADGFIVALAAANTLNLDLQNELSERSGIRVEGVNTWAGELASTGNMEDFENLKEWLLYRMATPAGRMSNAMESLDHMESIDVRGILENETVEIVLHLLILAENLGIDLEILLDNRWTEIEEESIL